MLKGVSQWFCHIFPKVRLAVQRQRGRVRGDTASASDGRVPDACLTGTRLSARTDATLLFCRSAVHKGVPDFAHSLFPAFCSAISQLRCRLRRFSAHESKRCFHSLAKHSPANFPMHLQTNRGGAVFAGSHAHVGRTVAVAAAADDSVGSRG